MIGKTVAATVAASVLMLGGASLASATYYGHNYRDYWRGSNDSETSIEIKNENTDVDIEAEAYANSGENEQEIEVSLEDSHRRPFHFGYWGGQNGEIGDPYQGMMTGEAVATTNLVTHVNNSELRLALDNMERRRGGVELEVEVKNEDTDVDIEAEAKAESGENEQEIELRQRSRQALPVIAQEMTTGRADSLVSASTFVNMLNLRISR